MNMWTMREKARVDGKMKTGWLNCYICKRVRREKKEEMGETVEEGREQQELCVRERVGGIRIYGVIR